VKRLGQSFQQQRPVGQSGERIVQIDVVRQVRGCFPVLPGVGVSQICGRDIGQRLRGPRRCGVQRRRWVPVQAQNTQHLVAVTKRNGQHHRQSGRDRAAGPLRRQAGCVATSGVQLEPQRLRIRRRHIPWLAAQPGEGSPGGGDRQHVHDPGNKIIKDAVDRRVGDHGRGELGQHIHEPLMLIAHPRSTGHGTVLASPPGPDCGDKIAADQVTTSEPAAQTWRGRCARRIISDEAAAADTAEHRPSTLDGEPLPARKLPAD